MTPPAPNLRPLIVNWKPAALFTLIKHGVKFTGMPAWPSPQRDDEVWAVVVFLPRLPELDEAGYLRLAHGEPTPTAPIQMLAPTDAEQQIPSAVNRTCVRCHGHDGLGRGSSAFPKLAGQRRDYLENALLAYANGKRHSGIMEPIAAGLTDEIVRELANYYAQLGRSVPSPPPLAEPEKLKLGRQIAHEGIPEQRIPACLECHGPAGRRTKSAYPLLAGQPTDYLVLQLELFAQGRRGGSSYAHLTELVASRLSSEQRQAVALYFESLSDAGR